ncbi:hypothetical protein IFM89_002388 [Coptis chinensis]|uniref:Uncharacterized protein n=1 Tax=Coptis chinensis TaxID=261450 RepID=A0A835ILD8_9MAGN|nr:hypothetical protein IFM89_002388 [Coptis chinensis]
MERKNRGHWPFRGLDLLVDLVSALLDWDQIVAQGTEKDITPIGGLPHYGVVKEGHLLIKGCCVRPKKRVATLRQSLSKQTSRLAFEVVAS